jgi:hypothetical protein
MKKLLYFAFAYYISVIVLQFIFIPEKYLYGHSNPLKIVLFISVVVFIPFCIGLFYYAKTIKKDKAIGLSILFVFFGLISLFTTTFIEKTKVKYQISNEGITIRGHVDSTYYRSTSSKHSTGRLYSEFTVKFEVNHQVYFSIPGFTDERIHNVGDPIRVKYLKRNPWLNKIYYRKE